MTNDTPCDSIEEWRSIPGFPLYEASSLGRIRSSSVNRWRPGRVKSVKLDSGGYLQVGVVKDGKQTTRSVHRLVCTAFHGEPPTSTHETAHNNGVRTDNFASNLRWALPVDNNADKIKHGTHQIGDNASNNVIDSKHASLIKALLKLNVSPKYISRASGIGISCIMHIDKGRSWPHLSVDQPIVRRKSPEAV